MSDLWPSGQRTISGSPLPSDFTDANPIQQPARRVELVGREEQLHQVINLLGNSSIRVVTLTDFGGTGKTTLALQAAYAMVGQFAGGVFFVDLSGLTQPGFILQSIARVGCFGGTWAAIARKPVRFAGRPPSLADFG